FFEDYISLCDYELRGALPPQSRVVTSDDVFDYMLSLRHINQGVDMRREEIFEEYIENKRGPFQLKSLEDYDQLKKVNQARHMTQSRYTRENMNGNVREQSNGESAFFYFTQRIGENGLYLLDEPENSLSPERQEELARFMEDSARFFGCQFIIATHSPFVLAMRGAKIYDLDSDPVGVRPWTALENVRAYYRFFREHGADFEREE
ncbi:MAG: AAA family ATPase, partial [Clostridia bacterium]|nr:AAA family ATPase [Clostridia bacterium]